MPNESLRQTPQVEVSIETQIACIQEKIKYHERELAFQRARLEKRPNDRALSGIIKGHQESLTRLNALLADLVQKNK